ncbi:MAG TPA: cyclic nucleotide-binding domain-containing protein [Dehalococcoidia bacterium]|nr:cyclic nucleotide-binding domain-containing protein [Dehalococcoidia bacterium]
MTNNPAPPQTVSIDCVIYTYNTRMRGQTRSTYERVSDLLNASEPEFLLLQDVTVHPLSSLEDEQLSAASLLIRKSNVILVLQPPDVPRQESHSSPLPDQATRIPRQATLEAGPFTIKGTLQLLPGHDPLEHVRESQSPFLEVSNATITYTPAPSAHVETPLVLVNRSWVEALLEGLQVTERRELGTQAAQGAALATEASDTPLADAVQREASEVDLSGHETAEFLFATEVFKGADLSLLAHTAEELSGDGGISRKICPAGTEVFREGEVGDALYVVESGELEVVAPDRGSGEVRRLATLGTGDIFGEMALLGAGRRTGTVKATSEATLLVLSTNAWRSLASRFPAATTNLLRIMVQRRGPRGGLLRSSG